MSHTAGHFELDDRAASAASRSVRRRLVLPGEAADTNLVDVPWAPAPGRQVRHVDVSSLLPVNA